MVDEIVVALFDYRLGLTDHAGMLSVVAEDALKNWAEVLGGVYHKFLDSRAQPTVPKLVFEGSSR